MNFGANSESVCCGFGHVGQQAKQQFSVQVGVLRADGQRQLENNAKKTFRFILIKNDYTVHRNQYLTQTGLALMSAGQELS